MIVDLVSVAAMTFAVETRDSPRSVLSQLVVLLGQRAVVSVVPLASISHSTVAIDSCLSPTEQDPHQAPLIMSYRIVPPTQQTSQAPSVVSHKSVAHPQTGTRDTLRYGLKTTNGEAGHTHVLEARLAQWGETQDRTKMTMQRNVYGVALPLRTMMEKRLVAEVSTSLLSLSSILLVHQN